jgi:hypothetical protein
MSALPAHGHSVKTTRIGLASAIASALVLVGGMPCAAADSDRDTQVEGPGVPDLGSAKNFYAEGRKKYKERDFAAALLNFQRAEEFRATPQAERYIGGCLDALGRYREAIDWYDRFLAHVPAHWASQGQHVRQRETEIRALPGRVQIQSSPAGASVEIDGKERGVSTPAALDLAPGPHKIRLAQEGRNAAEKSIDVAFASTQSIVLQLDESPPVAVAAAETGESSAAAAPSPSDGTESPPAIRSGGHSRLPAYLSAGVAVLAAGAGTAFGVVALSDKKTFERDPTPENASRRNSDALVADISFGVALAAAVTSAALFIFMKKDSPPPAPADGETERSSERVRSHARRILGIAPAPWVDPHGGGAGFVVQF